MSETSGSEDAQVAGSPSPLDKIDRYGTILLVANSEAADVPDLRARFGDEALFVFFNKVFKVLDRPFEGPSLLVARSSPAGANIVHRGEVDTVVSLLAAPGFAGIVNMCAAPAEVFSSQDAFGPTPVAHLDLAQELDGFYPAEHVATSGFALALWLTERFPQKRIVLSGFSARRSETWKLFEDHDWSFEQIVLRLMAEQGSLAMVATTPRHDFEVIAKRFPQFGRDRIAMAAAEVAAERLDGTNAMVDRLISLTRLQGRVRGLLQTLKPATRKQRLARRQAASDGEAGGESTEKETTKRS